MTNTLPMKKQSNSKKSPPPVAPSGHAIFDHESGHLSHEIYDAVTPNKDFLLFYQQESVAHLFARIGD